MIQPVIPDNSHSGFRLIDLDDNLNLTLEFYSKEIMDDKYVVTRVNKNGGEYNYYKNIAVRIVSNIDYVENTQYYKYCIKISLKDNLAISSPNEYFTFNIKRPATDFETILINKQNITEEWLKNNEQNFSEWSDTFYKNLTSADDFLNFAFSPNPNNLKDTLNISLGFQEGDTDTLTSYKIILTLNNSTLVESDKIYTAGSNQVSYDFFNIFWHQFNKNYQLSVIYETKKGFINKVNKIITTPLDTRELAENITLEITATNTFIWEPSIEIQFNFIENPEYKPYQQKELVFYRTNKNNASIEVIKIIDLNTVNFNDVFSTSFKDYSVVFGFYYNYYIYYQTVDNDGIVKYKESNLTEDIILLSEDVYLIDKTDKISIKYNVEISNFKYNYLDSVTSTLGGSYPFIRRNGKQKYRSFELKGTISCHNDSNDFIQESFIQDSLNRDGDTSLSKNIYSNLNFYDQQSLLERDYRERIFNFLYNGKLKIFKSLQEGNMIVYLMNVSLTPNKTLSRNIYDFSATVIEAMEFTLDNLKNNNLLISELIFDYQNQIKIYKDYYIIGEQVDGITIIDENNIVNENNLIVNTDFWNF